MKRKRKKHLPAEWLNLPEKPNLKEENKKVRNVKEDREKEHEIPTCGTGRT